MPLGKMAKLKYLQRSVALNGPHDLNGSHMDLT